MCGIVASISKRGRADEEALRSATSRLRHRGPDAQRVWVSDDRRVGLGHSRLSIIDLETGDQPIASEDERLRIVANGELYDFERIRAELQGRGHLFRTKSDSEIALHLYEDFGTRALSSLRGEYAFVLWDARDDQLVAVRDRFGIKPLYYAVYDGAVHLASEVKALAALGVPLRWDLDTLYDTHFVSHPPDRTLFSGIYQVPPGCCLFTDGEHVRLHQYWDWNYPVAERTTPDGRDEEWIARLRESLDEAVRLRLRADVPVACYLSGGIDSCAVLGFAARLSPRPLRAYTLSFDHADYDEASIAEAQARRSGADLCRIDVRATDLADNFRDAIYHAERPFANAHAIAKFLLSRAVRDSGIKVVLTGEGSDEVFAGYPHFRRDLVLYGTSGADRDAIARLLGELDAANRVSAGTLLPDGSTPLDSVERVLGYVPSNLQAWAQIGSGLLRAVDDDVLRSFARRDTYRILMTYLDVEGRLAGRHPVNQSLYIWGKTMLPNYILSNLGDRMEMAHSVEGRLPFLDHHVVELAAEMPVAMKIKGMTEKYVLREAARDVLIDEVYARQKHPFMTPPATVQQDGRLYTFLQDTLRGSSLDRPGIYDRKKVTQLLDAIPSMEPAGRGRADALLMWMASVCLLPDCLGMQRRAGSRHADCEFTRADADRRKSA
jgi:asparagine synthase (glutamine-hydrolysing)